MRFLAEPDPMPTSARTRNTVDLIPTESTLADLRAAAATCTGCALYQNATQTVFGEGPEAARLMLVGEQPGDAEDIAGRPFVGPAGKLLDRCLAEAGIERSRCYVTNVVKHFKWVPRGPRRIHSKPGTVRIAAAFPPLPAEAGRGGARVIWAARRTASQGAF